MLILHDLDTALRFPVCPTCYALVLNIFVIRLVLKTITLLLLQIADVATTTTTTIVVHTLLYGCL